MRIDVHAHFFPDALFAVLDRFNLAGPDVPRVLPAGDQPEALAARFAMMDTAGVEMQVLSISSMFPYLDRENDAVETAHRANDIYSDAVARYPERFAAFAALPMPHIDASLRELARTLDDLLMAGITIGPTVLGKSVAAAEFEPIYEELNRRAAVVFMHPCGNGACSPLVRDEGLTWPIGAPFEDTIFALHLIRRQIPIRYPEIKFIVPHLGGLLPLALDRLDDHAELFTLDPRHPPEPPSAIARRLWFDTVAHGSIAALRCAHAVFGASRLLHGSDYPFQLGDGYVRSVSYIRDAGFSATDTNAILSDNATRLLGFAAGKR